MSNTQPMARDKPKERAVGNDSASQAVLYFTHRHGQGCGERCAMGTNTMNTLAPNVFTHFR